MIGIERRHFLLLGAIALLAGCSSLEPRLKPADGTHRVRGMDFSAVAGDQQIEVIAQTGAWPGDPALLEGLEPIRVRIGNYGVRPVHVQYSRIRLVAPDGRRFAPLPIHTGRRANALPTPEMLERALPDGVIDVSGHVDGYLYFQVPPELERIQFEAVLVAPPAVKPAMPSSWLAKQLAAAPNKPEVEETVARVSIPFVVE